MGDVLNLATTNYNAAKVDLLRGRWRLRQGGFAPKTGSRAKLTETLRLRADGSAAEIALGEKAIQGLLEQARRYMEDPHLKQGVWLEWSVDGEPGAGTQAAKRAFVYDGALELAMPAVSRGGFARGTTFGNLALTRHPLWENTVYEQFTAAAVSVLGGKADLSGEAAYCGTEPGRLENVELTQAHGALRTWMGIRPWYDGIANFVSLWELELGTPGTDTAVDHDATASPGGAGHTKLTCTFATVATRVERVQILLGDVCGVANREHNIGRYLVLLRAKNSAAGTCYLRMRSGMDGTPQATQGDNVAVESTAWHLYELGQVQFPPPGYRQENPQHLILGNCGIWLDAERVSGACSLELDCLVLIPTWSMVMIDNQAFSGDVGIITWAVTLPDDTAFVVESSGGGAGPSYADPAPSNWCMPREPGVLVLACDQTAGSSLVDTVDLEIYWDPRWRLYRGV
jgi:hypothetical protein